MTYSRLHAAAVATLTALSTLAASDVSLAQTSAAADHGWSTQHPVAIGNRLTGRVGTYALGGVGGHIRFRPHRYVAIELFTDHMAGPVDGAIRHDHEVGGVLQIPVLGNRWWNLYPMIGACASLVVLEPPRQGGVAVQDIHFGVHVGAGSELYLSDHWSLVSHIEAIGYVGHDLRAYNWTAQLSTDVHLSAVVQGVLSVNYYF